MGVHPDTVRRWIDHGRLPAHQPGGVNGKYMLWRDDLEALSNGARPKYDEAYFLSGIQTALESIDETLVSLRLTLESVLKEKEG